MVPVFWGMSGSYRAIRIGAGMGVGPADITQNRLSK
jgi:hypothetical protein